MANALLKKLEDTFKELEALVDISKERFLSEEEQQKYDSLLKEYEDAKAKIAAQKDQQERFASLKDDHMKAEKAVPRWTGTGSAEEGKLEVSDENKLQRSFKHFLRTGNLPHTTSVHAYNQVMLEKIKKNLPKDDEILQKADLSAFIDTEGGVTAPPEFKNKLIERMYNDTPITRLITIEPIRSKSVEIPIFNRDSGGDTYGEGDTFTAEDFASAFGEKIMTAHKFVIFWQSSKEFLAESIIDVEGFFVRHFSGRLGRLIESKVISGTGALEPRGLLNNPELLTDAPDTTDTITADFLVDVAYALKPQYRVNAVWVFNKAYLKQLRKLKDDNAMPLWNIGQSLAPGQPGTLLGYPVIESEDMPASTTSTGDEFGFFGDLKKYWMVIRDRISFEKSDHLLFNKDKVAYKLVVRLDGDNTDGNAGVLLQRA